MESPTLMQARDSLSDIIRFSTKPFTLTELRVTAALVERGATVAKTPADAARGQAIVITMVSDEHALAAILDGPDGLTLARSGEWDLVVLDLLLPGMNGLRVLQELHRDRPQLPVVVLSARGDLRTKLKGFELGEGACKR